MTTQKNHPAAGQPDSFDRYPSYYGSDLELTYTPQRSVFTLWAPTADKVRLNLYASGEGGEPEERLEMRPSDDGTWARRRGPRSERDFLSPSRSRKRGNGWTKRPASGPRRSA